MGPAKACTSKHDTIMTTLVVFIMNLLRYEVIYYNKIEVIFLIGLDLHEQQFIKLKTLLVVVFC